MGVKAGHERCARRATTSGVIDLGEAQTVCGELIQMRRIDFTAVRTDVGIAEVVEKDDDDVGT